MSRIRIDLRYVEVEYELWALRHMLNVIEPAIAHLSAEDEAETLAELRGRGWIDDEAEYDLARQETREKREYVLPRFMRGPFLIALAACFESGVTSIAHAKQRELHAALCIDDLRGETSSSEHAATTARS
jgi:hypothetical protein